MAGQYEDAFRPPRMQCWTLPRPPPQRPTPHPPTAFITNDRGHLLPHVPRSKVSPWGTFLGTWDMPRHIPPPWLDLSSRSPGAATRVIQSQPQSLRRACNGTRIRVTGKLQQPWDTEPSGKGAGGLTGGSAQPEAPNPEEPQNPPGPEATPSS